MQTILHMSDNPAVIIKALELNKSAYELGLMGTIPGAQIVHRPEITYVATGLPDSALNVISRTSVNDEQAEQLVADTVAYFKQDEVPFTWNIGPSTRPLHADKLLDEHGLIHEYDAIGLGIDLAHLVPAQSVEPLEVRRCVTQQEMRDFCYVQRLLTESYALHAFWSRIAQLDVLMQPMIELYVGYVNNEPVCGLAMVPYGGLVGIYALATAPDSREKGYASVLLHTVLMQAATRGYALACTTSAQQYAGFFKRLGFQALCMFQVYGMQWNRDQYELAQ